MRDLKIEFFFFNDTAPTEIYTLSLHDALPILKEKPMQPHNFFSTDATPSHSSRKNLILNSKKSPRSTEHTSELQSPCNVECHLLLDINPFAARVPSDSKGSECQCGIHTAEAASALRSRKTERAAKEKRSEERRVGKEGRSRWSPNH